MPALEAVKPRALGYPVLAALVSLCMLSPARALTSQSVPAGGVVLDGWGGLHPFGGAEVNLVGAPYWKGWDIARGLVLQPDGGGGWVLDGWGSIHSFGSAPGFGSPDYWPGWDIARALAVDPDQRGGYVLDGWGGVHPFGNAPTLTGAPYWQGNDIARGVSIHYSSGGVPDGGWTLDAWGGIHAFGSAPAISSYHYYPGFDFWRQLHVNGDGTQAYALGRWAVLDQMVNGPATNWSGYPAWGGWDIVRDAVLLSTSGTWQAPPADRLADGALIGALNNLDRSRRGLPPLGFDPRVGSIAGAGAAYDLHACGGSGTIADRSADMFNRNYFSHVIPGCAAPDYVWQTYYAAHGIRWSSAGENIGWITVADLPDAAWQVNNAWLNSPVHLANITARSYSAIGCGGYTGSGYQGSSGQVWIWTCDFRG